MPPSRRPASTPDTSSNASADVEGLRPYQFHGLDLSLKGDQATSDCPLCGKSGKFSIQIDTTRFKCWSCGASGNALAFIRQLYEVSVRGTSHDFIESVMHDRRLCNPDTVTAWGVCKSAITSHTWLLPGYGVDGKLDQLYKRTQIQGSDGVWSWRLLPTPGIWPEGKVHALHLAINDFKPDRSRIDLLEGPWDAMAYWEILQTTMGSEDSNVVAVPGCNVWRDDWTTLCKGKDVTIWYDSDRPRLHNGQTFSAGYDGTRRVARKLSGHASSISWLKWGPDGYDPSLPDGWDVRDSLSGATSTPNSLADRRDPLISLIGKIEGVPIDWLVAQPPGNNNHVANVEPQPCDNWNKCRSAWEDALEWRDELSEVMITMLAVAASTNQSGDNQLFLRVIGDPGSAKTRMCKGLLVSRHCKLLLHLKSFHSGFKMPGQDNVDCSLVSRISGLCLITPEADALTLGTNSDQLDSQARQIFDGESGSTYSNNNEDRHYKGLRSPWIQAGTPALMDKDQSRLGDRFLRIRIEQPDEETKQSILLRALRNERKAVIETANGTESSIIPPKLRKAYAITGGYVDWLRANIEEKISEVERNISEHIERLCVDMAILTADMRARPNNDAKKTETFPTKELPSRLVSQLGRLAMCAAVVMNKQEVDSEVMRIVRKVALDTAHGHTLNIVQWMCCHNPRSNPPGKTYHETGGISEKTLAVWCNMTVEKVSSYLMFLRKIGVVEIKQSQAGSLWALTDRMYRLYMRVMREW